MTSAYLIKIKTKRNIKIYETIKPTELTSTNAKLYERRTLTLAKDKRMDIQMDERPSDDGMQRLLLCTASRSYKHQTPLTLYAVFLSFFYTIFLQKVT